MKDYLHKIIKKKLLKRYLRKIIIKSPYMHLKSLMGRELSEKKYVLPDLLQPQVVSVASIHHVLAMLVRITSMFVIFHKKIDIFSPLIECLLYISAASQLVLKLSQPAALYQGRKRQAGPGR